MKKFLVKSISLSLYNFTNYFEKFLFSFVQKFDYFDFDQSTGSVIWAEIWYHSSFGEYRYYVSKLLWVSGFFKKFMNTFLPMLQVQPVMTQAFELY